ncbi:hypothetical protein [Haliangium sp.]|uniref:hypothetical protein n=1 Tax=Haliangium sp. TaxID=2663208 RepID=UPI003D0A15F7
MSKPFCYSPFAAAVGAPPFDFSGVVARVFPLRAAYDRLQRFCNIYLNMMPPELGWFRPAAPYVYLAVLNYGQMSTELARARFGWVSQNEVFFSIPLEWYRFEGGKPVFVDWASVSPYIFVDDPMSRATGREVYGWPKESAWFAAEVNTWTKDPRAASNLMCLRTEVFANPYSGSRAQPRTLLEISRQARIAPVGWPPQWRNPISPLVAIPKAITNMLELGKDWFDLWSSPPMRDLGSWRHRAELIFTRLRGLASDGARPGSRWAQSKGTSPLSFHTVNLKQFPDTDDAEYAAFQAITDATMTVRGFNRGGLLGEDAMLLGDPSGGFLVKLHRHTAYPIIETLGLQLHKHYQVEDPSASPLRGQTAGSPGYTRLEDMTRDEDVHIGSHGVAVLKPVFPFWTETNLEYGAPRNLGWRAKGSSVWHGPDDRPVSTDTSSTQAKLPGDPNKPVYNTSVHAYTMVAGPPYRFPNVTLRVFGLPADEAALQRHCDRYLNHAPGTIGRFEPCTGLVMLMVFSFEEMTSETNNLGWWEDRQVSFQIPLWWHPPGGGEPELTLTAAYSFSRGEVATLSAREVSGQATIQAGIDSPPDVWMDDSGPITDRALMWVRTKVFPALQPSVTARDSVLLELVEGPIVPDWATDKTKLISYPDTSTQDRWLAEYGPKLLTRVRERHPLRTVHLRQIRDTNRPELACFQSLVESRMVWDLLEEGTEDAHRQVVRIDDQLHLRVHHYPTHPIVETLGIQACYHEQVKSAQPNRIWEGTRVDCIQPLGGLWVKIAVAQECAHDLCWRLDDGPWTIALPTATDAASGGHEEPS